MQNSGIGVSESMPGALSSVIPGIGSTAGMVGVGVNSGMNPIGVTNNQQLPPVPIMANPEGAQQFCLRWNSYPATVATQLAALRQAEDFVDVTLACDGRQLRAHKLVLSACSPYFMQLFKSTPCQHPVIFLRDVGFRQLVALLEFMYAGEVNVSQVELPALLRTAEALQVRGLADTNPNNNCPPPPQQNVTQPTQLPPPQQQQQQQQPQLQKQTFSPHYTPTVNQQQQQPVMPTPPPAASLNTSVDEGQGNPEPSSQSPNSATGQANKRKRRSSSANVNTIKLDDDENSSDSNDSQDFGEVGEEEMKAYINDGSISDNLEESGEVFAGGTEDPGGDPFDITQADLGSDAVGGSQSEEVSSEDEDVDEDEDVECKEFTYQSDASCSQEPGGNSNSNGESAAGPSGGIGGSSGDSGSTMAGGSKGEPGEIPVVGSGGGSGRNRLTRSLWPPGIPYHGPQQCPYCPRVLSNVGNWRKHVLTMHFAREKVYKCNHCASAFRTAEYLQKHYVRVHSYPQKMSRRKYVENT